MNPSNQNPTLGQPSTPEEDIALQAIESLDVEGNTEPGEPETSPTTASAEESSEQNAPEPAPIVTNPIADIKAMPPAPEKPSDPSPSPKPTSSAADTSLAAANAEPAPATEAFQPFAQQKPTHSPFKVVLVILLILVVLGGGAYFGWQFFL